MKNRHIIDFKEKSGYLVKKTKLLVDNTVVTV